jgi:hypothetical protein
LSLNKRVRKWIAEQSGKLAIEGDSLYAKSDEELSRYPEYHRAREILWESGGPPSKAKYYSMTDSELVP